MSQGHSDDDFNRARAELFEALGHPTRIRILEAMKDGPMGFSELKKVAGIESSGHLTFHVEKLNGLVKVTSDGRYALTDDGKEAIRLVGRRATTGLRPPLRTILTWSLVVAVAAGLIIAALQLAFFPEGISTSLGFPRALVVTLVVVYLLVFAAFRGMNQWQKRKQEAAQVQA